MKAALAIFDVVPGWLYAATIALLTVFLVRAELATSQARVAAAQAGQARAEDAATGSAAATSSVQSARAKESVMAASQAEDVHELNQAISNPAARAAELGRGMHDHAAAVARSGGGCLSPAAGGASRGDEREGPGLRAVVEPDPLILDGQAQSELAQLVVSARDTGETLKTARKALDRCVSAAE